MWKKVILGLLSAAFLILEYITKADRETKTESATKKREMESLIKSESPK